MEEAGRGNDSLLIFDSSLKSVAYSLRVGCAVSRFQVSQKRGLWIILVLYLVTATGWAWLNPVFEAPDEPFHVAYVNLLLKEHRWPKRADLIATVRFLEQHADPETDFRVFEAGQSEIFMEWAQPPLYYALQMIPMALIYPRGFGGVLIPARTDFRTHWERGYFRHDPAEPWLWSRQLIVIRLMRMLSVLLGGVAVWLTAWLAGLVAPREPHLPLLSAGIYAFIPMFTFMTASVNNDVLGYVSATAMLCILLLIARDAWPPVRAAIAVGLGLGLALLSKPTTLFLWLLTPFVTVLLYRRWRDRSIFCMGAIAVGALIVWPFFSTRAGLHLDLLGFVFTGTPSSWLTFSTGFLGDPVEPSLSYFGRVVAMLGESFWGRFGWFQVLINRNALVIYWFVAGAALVGWCWKDSDPARPHGDRRTFLILGGAVGAFLISAIFVYLRVFIPQGGRYLLVVGSVIAITMALGLYRTKGVFSKFFRRSISDGGFTWGLVTLFVALNWTVLICSVYQPYRAAWEAGS